MQNTRSDVEHLISAIKNVWRLERTISFWLYMKERKLYYLRKMREDYKKNSFWNFIFLNGVGMFFVEIQFVDFGYGMEIVLIYFWFLASPMMSRRCSKDMIRIGLALSSFFKCTRPSTSQAYLNNPFFVLMASVRIAWFTCVRRFLNQFPCLWKMKTLLAMQWCPRL